MKRLIGTELALFLNPKEQMAIIIDEKDADFIKAECKENLEVVKLLGY